MKPHEVLARRIDPPARGGTPREVHGFGEYLSALARVQQCEVAVVGEQTFAHGREQYGALLGTTPHPVSGGHMRRAHGRLPLRVIGHSDRAHGPQSGGVRDDPRPGGAGVTRRSSLM